MALTPNYATDSTVYAATTGVAGAFYTSTTGGGTAGAYTAQGLFADTFTDIRGIDADPVDGSPLFMVLDGGQAGDGAVFKGTTRTGLIPGVDVTNVRVSTNYATDSTVYLAGGTTLARSTNGGDSFTDSGTTGIPSTVIRGVGLAVADTNTVFAASSTKVHRTTDGGTTWASASLSGSPTITDIEVSPNYANDSTVMVATRSPAGAPQVFMSTDGGTTFTQTGSHKDTSTGSEEHVVAFDSNYATNSTVYSGTDSNLYRWTVGTSTAWLELDPDEDGDGSNGEISGLAATGGLLIASFKGSDDVMRAHTPTGDYDGGTKLQWFNLGWVNIANTANTALGDGVMDQGGETTSTFSLMGSGLLAVPTSATSFTWFAVDTFGDQVRSYKDVLLAAPTVTGPADESSRTSAPTLSWAPFTALTSADFVVRLSTDPTFADVLRTSYTPVTAPNTFSLSTSGLTPGFGSGNTYYWQVSATTSAATAANPEFNQDVQSPWSPMRSYIAAAGLPGLLFPVSAPGLRQEIPSTTPGLSWTAVGAAVDYRIQIATDPTLVSSAGSYVTPILTREVGSATPALQLVAGDLQPGTIYYWQVQALFASNAEGNYTSLGPPPFADTGPPATPACSRRRGR